MVERIDITSPEAIQYLKEHLDLSGKVFAKQMQTLSLSKGRVFAIVPEDTPSERLFKFKQGWIEPMDDVDPFVIEYIITYLEDQKDNCCLIEEPHAWPSDPWVTSSGIQYIHFNKEMYYFFNSDFEPKALEESFKTSKGYYSLCALSSMSSQMPGDFSPFTQVDPGQLRELANKVVTFICSAYDGQGYLLWEKEKV